MLTDCNIYRHSLLVVQRDICWIFFNTRSDPQSAVNFCNTLNAGMISVRNAEEEQLFIEMQ